MKVSVVIPTYNRAALLPRALDSVLDQTRPAHEILVVDDGSTDGTASLIKQHYPDIRYISQRHAGVSAARNAGMHTSQGDWIAFLDSDDAWRPEKLARQIELLGRHPDHYAIHCDEIWIRAGRRINQKKRHQKQGGWIFQHCLPMCRISPSSLLLHRQASTCIGPFDETLPVCEDYDMWLRLTSRYPVLYVNSPLVTKYGGHGDQLSKRYAAMDRFRIRSLNKLLKTPDLNDDDRRAAVATLVKKIDIVLQGAKKRRLHLEVFRLRMLREHFASEMAHPC